MVKPFALEKCVLQTMRSATCLFICYNSATCINIFSRMSVMKLIKFNWILHSGMWGTFSKLHSGFRACQTAKHSEAADLRCAMMARSTKKYHLMKVLVLWSEFLVKKINVRLSIYMLERRWWHQQLEMDS